MNSQCAADSVHETEANDTAETANALPGATSSFCGTITSAADVDFAAFTLPASATKLGFTDSYSQTGVVFSVTVDGTEYPLGGSPPFKPGDKYTVKVHSTGAVPANYRLSVSITGK